MPTNSDVPSSLDKYGFQVPPGTYLRETDTTMPWNLVIVTENRVPRSMGGFGIDIKTNRYSLYSGARVTLLDGTDLDYWGILNNRYIFRVYAHGINGPKTIDDIGLSTLVSDIGVREVIGPDDTVLYPIEVAEEIPTEEP